MHSLSPAFAFAALLLTLGSVSGAAAQATSGATTRRAYAEVDGLRIYHEVHGAGRPIVLLHGSYMTIDLNWSALIPELAKKRQVIAMEMQGHGRTADSNRPFSYAALADDVAGLLKHLGLAKADVLGYSLGGTVALETAIRHPEVVDYLIVVSSVFKLDGWLKEARELFPTISPELFEATPLKAEYDRLAPDPSHWPAFVTKLAKFDATPYDLGAQNVRAIACPVLIIKGDNDGVDLEHVTEMYKLLGGDKFGDVTGLPRSRLAVLPGATHTGVAAQTQQLTELITTFLEGAR